jgi:hypothetical protein
MAIWNILPTFGIFYDHLVQFVFIWYIFSGFGIMHQEKSGNPAAHYSMYKINSMKANISKFLFDPSYVLSVSYGLQRFIKYSSGPPGTRLAAWITLSCSTSWASRITWETWTSSWPGLEPGSRHCRRISKFLDWNFK